VALQLAVGGMQVPIEAESSVLGVLSVTRARYGMYAHTILAEKAGLTSAQVEDMLAGNSPKGVTERIAAIYKISALLAQTRGPLALSDYNAAVSVLGQTDLLATINQAAAFMFASITLNAGDVCVPAGVEDPDCACVD
jgi:hypothetical protein